MLEFVGSHEVIEDVVCFRLQGKMSQATVPEFLALFTDCFSKGRHKIVLNCQDLIEIRSVHLGVLFRSLVQARKSDGDIKFVQVERTIWNSMEMMGFADRVQNFDSEGAAIGDFN